jgi:hypothetical protein
MQNIHKLPFHSDLQEISVLGAVRIEFCRFSGRIQDWQVVFVGKMDEIQV